MTFETLYSTYYRLVFARLLSYTRSPEQAEDLCQETFLKAWRAFGRIDTRNVRGWLLTIACRVYLDSYRHSRLVAVCSLEASGIDVPVACDEDARLDGLAVLAQVPTLLLYVAVGYSYREAAARFGYSEDAIRMVIRRARLKLKEKRIA